MTQGDGASKILELEDVHTYYGSIHAIKGISLEVYDGEIVTLIGSNGAGKSTTLRSINGLNTPREGSIVFQGKNITRRPPHEIVQMGISQSPEGRRLFPHMTVLENVVKAPVAVKGMSRAQAEVVARALLAKVGLSDRLDYYPSQLSGGQQQRAAIARALAMSPEVMLYDEPTSSLDPTLVNEVLQIMRQLHDEGMTQVVVTHEMRFARDVADHILFMHEGLLVEAGPPAALFTAPRDPRTRDFLKSFL